MGVHHDHRCPHAHLEEDRELHLDIAAAEELIASGELLKVVEECVGDLE